MGNGGEGRRNTVWPTDREEQEFTLSKKRSKHGKICSSKYGENDSE